MLEIRGLTVRYGTTVAVDGLDLTVGDHEVVCVLGPSGSGKSTLLRAIAGLERPDAGVIARDGVDLADAPPHRRGLGLMFQDHALFPHRDVLRNVAFGLRMRDVPRDQATARAGEVLALVGLEGFEHRSIRDLSGGEQQRVALARALAPEPSLLMLDEPLGALDAALRDDLAGELRELFDRLGLAVLLVTHDQDEAFALGDRVAIMYAGRIDQIGTPVEVWRNPASGFVADFLGWNVTRAPDGARIAIRPDALRVSSDGELSGIVVARTFRRDHFRVEVQLDDGDDRLALTIRDDAPPSPGDAVRLAVDPDGVVSLGT
ncbi:MAG: ABC transporter ATP-binding protein [Acidimicrobiia bacterium]